MKDTDKMITEMVIDYKEDAILLAKMCKLMRKLKNARVKVKIEDVLVNELMVLSKRIKGLENYLDKFALGEQSDG